MKKWLWLSLALVLVLAACSPAAAPGAQITVKDPWGRTSPMVAGAGAFYMVIENKGSQADKLVGAKSDACGSVELHESFQNADGTMGMRPVAGGTIDVPANGTVELKPGGMHIMCIQKKVDFKEGVTVPVMLQFATAGEMKVTVAIKDMGGM